MEVTKRKISIFVEQYFVGLILLIFFVSLVSRLILFREVGPVWAGDTPQYIEVAENFVQYKALLEIDDVTGNLKPQTLRTPGYSLTVAFFFMIFKEEEPALNALVIFQIILVSGISIHIGYIGKWYFSAEIGLMAALFVMVDPWLTFACLNLLTEALFSFLFTASFLLAAIALEKWSWQWSLLWGSLLGICTMVRPVSELLFVIPVILFAILPISRKHKIGLMVAAVGGFVLLIGGWVVRNYSVTGEMVLATHQGRSMLWETAYLTRYSTPQDYIEDANLAAARDLIAETPMIIEESMAENPHQERLHQGQVAFLNLRKQLGLSEFEADAIMKKIAIENILSNPLDYFVIGMKNTFYFLTRISKPISIGVDLGWISKSVPESIVSGNYFYPLINFGLRLITFVSFVPLLLIGIYKSGHGIARSNYLTLVFALVLIYFIVVSALVVPDDRYRLPLHGMMWLYVATAIVSFPWNRYLLDFFRRFPGIGVSLKNTSLDHYG